MGSEGKGAGRGGVNQISTVVSLKSSWLVIVIGTPVATIQGVIMLIF